MGANRAMDGVRPTSSRGLDTDVAAHALCGFLKLSNAAPDCLMRNDEFFLAAGEELLKGLIRLGDID
jgi:hypothetical protein